jgi:hypothetical protein
VIGPPFPCPLAPQRGPLAGLGARGARCELAAIAIEVSNEDELHFTEAQFDCSISLMPWITPGAPCGSPYCSNGKRRMPAHKSCVRFSIGEFNMATAKHSDAVLTFGLLLACAGAVTAAISWQALVGFVLGVTATFAAAAVAGGSNRLILSPTGAYSPHDRRTRQPRH